MAPYAEYVLRLDSLQKRAEKLGMPKRFYFSDRTQFGYLVSWTDAVREGICLGRWPYTDEMKTLDAVDRALSNMETEDYIREAKVKRDRFNFVLLIIVSVTLSIPYTYLLTILK